MLERNKDWCVWVYVDAADRPTYIGVDRARPGKPHPAVELWDKRFRESTSVASWLRGLHAMPKYNTLHGPGISQVAALELASTNRAVLRDLGLRLLTTRETVSYAQGETHGGGLAKAVIDDKGNVYASMRDAARTLGIDHSSVSRYVKSGKWRMAEATP
jgi:hypothetical protein